MTAAMLQQANGYHSVHTATAVEMLVLHLHSCNYELWQDLYCSCIWCLLLIILNTNCGFLTVQVMPAGYQYQLVSGQRRGSGFCAHIRLPCSTPEECNKWLAAFASSCYCTWRTRRTYPAGRRGLIYRKDYVCQHSSFNKGHGAHSQKGAGCEATLTIKVSQ